MENIEQKSQDDVLPIAEVHVMPRSSCSPWSGVRREAPGNPLHGQGRKSPTGAKMKSDVKLETFEDFREGENLKSRQLLVISSSEAPLPGARVNLVVLQPCLGTSSHLRIKLRVGLKSDFGLSCELD